MWRANATAPMMQFVLRAAHEYSCAGKPTDKRWINGTKMLHPHLVYRRPMARHCDCAMRYNIGRQLTNGGQNESRFLAAK
jgi:hypothetical protein